MLLLGVANDNAASAIPSGCLVSWLLAAEIGQPAEVYR